MNNIIARIFIYFYNIFIYFIILLLEFFHIFCLLVPSVLLYKGKLGQHLNLNLGRDSHEKFPMRVATMSR